MKEIAGDHHQVWIGLGHIRHGGPKRPGHIRFPLIDPLRRLPVVLAKSEMYVS